MNHGGKVGEADLHGVGKAHVAEGLCLQADRIVIKFTVKENPGNPVPAQHDAVLLLGIGTAGIERNVPAKGNIVRGGRALAWHHLIPPRIDLGDLREETVPAHIHTVSLILHGSGNTAELVALLEDCNLVVPGSVQQLIGSGQAGRAGADNQSLFHAKSFLSYAEHSARTLLLPLSNSIS